MAFWVGRQSVMEASCWCEIGRNGINQLFPELYDIAVEMDASINSYLKTQNDGAHICKTSYVTLVMGSCGRVNESRVQIK